MVTPILKRYVLALKRYKWAGLAGFLGILGASSVVAIQPPPEEVFISEGALAQNAPVVSLTATGVELQQQGQLLLDREFLLGDALLEDVLQILSQQGVSLTVREVRQNASVRVEDDDEERQQVLVSLTSDDPEESELVLNALFARAIDLSRDFNRNRLTAIVDALNERLPIVETELRQAEQALELYDRNRGPAIQAARDGSLLAAISGTENQGRQNALTLEGINAQIQSIQSRLGLSIEGAYLSSALSADPIVAQIRARIYEAETQRGLLSQTLRDGHPTMVELNNNLQTFEQLLVDRGSEVTGQQLGSDLLRQLSNLDPARAALANQLVELDTQREALIRQQALLGRSINQLAEDYRQLPNVQLERDRLAQQVALKRALYDQLQAKRIDAQAAEAETVTSISVITPPSTAPVMVETTNPLTVLLIGAVVGLALGGGIVYLLDMFDSTIRLYEDLDSLLEEQDVPLLGLIPEMPPRRRRAGLSLILNPDNAHNDIYERLRSNLQIAGVQASEGKIPQTILITSTRDQEGKTTTAFNLGIASARAGRRTLILEMDLRSPSKAEGLGIRQDQQAILEPLRYYGGKLSDPVQMVPGVENLYISPSVGPQRNPVTILDSSELARFLKEAKSRFDFVVVDVPHLTGSNDAMLLEPKSDGMVIVTRPDFTEKPVLTTTLEQIEDNEDLRLLGAVINGAKIPVAEAQRKDAEFAARNDPEQEDEEVTAKDVPVFTSVDF